MEEMENLEQEIEDIIRIVKEDGSFLPEEETVVAEEPVGEETEETVEEAESMKQAKKNAPKKKKMSAGKKTLITILAVLLALLLLALAGLIYVDRMIGLINLVDETLPSMNAQEMEDFLNQEKETMDPDFTGDVINPDDLNWESMNDGKVMHSDSVINILLIGQDRRPGESRARSDSMILCSFNKVTKELTLTSFMRDMYVAIPGYSAHKINSAFAWGGMGLLNETLKTNFGIVVDGNFAVDFNSFKDVIDILGGVDIHLTSSEANYINGYLYSEGVNHLDGEDALKYSRIRNIGNADFGRTQRQRNVINAIVKKCMSKSLVELNSLMEQVLPLLSTNMDKSTIMGYAAELLPMLAGIKINESLRIPADDTWNYAWVSEMSVLMPNFDANREILWQELYQ